MKHSPFVKITFCAFIASFIYAHALAQEATGTSAPETPASPAPAQQTVTQPVGNSPSLMVFPTIILLEGSKRTEEILLTNRGDKEKRYRIFLSNKGMDTKGNLIDLPDDSTTGQLSAVNAVRFSPRQVVIGPNSSQTIRLMSRLPADAADGEYRAHMTFMEISEDTKAPVDDTNSQTISVQLNTNFGVSIPLIIRKGTLTASGSIINPRIQTIDGKANIVFDLTRSGNESLMGNLVATRNGVEIGKIVRLAAYTSTPQREVRIPINPDKLAGQSLTGTPITLTLTPLENLGSNTDAAPITATFTP